MLEVGGSRLYSRCIFSLVGTPHRHYKNCSLGGGGGGGGADPFLLQHPYFLPQHITSGHAYYFSSSFAHTIPSCKALKKVHDTQDQITGVIYSDYWASIGRYFISPIIKLSGGNTYDISTTLTLWQHPIIGNMRFVVYNDICEGYAVVTEKL